MVGLFHRRIEESDHGIADELLERAAEQPHADGLARGQARHRCHQRLLRCGIATREILEPMLQDTEEDHAHWLEQQLWLIQQVGLENYLQSAMKLDDKT